MNLIAKCDELILPYILSTDTFSYPAVKIAIDYLITQVDKLNVRVIDVTPTKGVCALFWAQDGEIENFIFKYEKGKNHDT